MDNDLHGLTAGSQFETTNWSLVRAASADNPAAARDALAELCRAYWYPVYSHVRRKGAPASAAEDLTQGFFLHFIESRIPASADPAAGRFRAYLLASCNHFLANQRAKMETRKRGGGRAIVSFDSLGAEQRFLAEPVDRGTPDRLFDRQWALALLAAALGDLAEECSREGRWELFARLRPMLTLGGETASYAQIGAELAMTQAAVKKAAERLRRRYGELLRARTALTLQHPGDLEDEIHQLRAALESSF